VRDTIRNGPASSGGLVANDFSGALVSAIVLDQDARGKPSIRSRSPTSSN